MTVISDRVAIKELCQTTLAAAFTASATLDEVVVYYGDPGELVANDMVILGEMNGRSDAVVFAPSGSDDEFTIKCEIFTTQHATAVEADRKAQDILDLVNATLFTSRFAQSLGARVFPAAQDGPNSVAPYDGNPAASAVEFEIAVRVAVRGT